MESLARDSFVFYRSFYEALQQVPKTHRTAIYEACFTYVFESREVSLSGVPGALWALIKPQLDASQRRYENAKKGAEHGKKGAEYGKLGGRPKKEKPPLRGNEQNPLNVNDNVNVNVNDNVSVNGNATEVPPAQTHTVPSLEEIKAYCKERKNSIDAKKFYEYYEMREWKLSNGGPMKDWKAAVRYWETREKDTTGSGTRNASTKFTNFEERSDTDWDAIELAMIKRSMEPISDEEYLRQFAN